LKKKAADGWIAVSVILCSIVLFLALALGLSGRVLVRDGHAVRVRFHDITGIKVSSQVKFAGAPAGSVSGVRMLTASERLTDPDHLVEITLNLLRDVPPLTKNTQVSIAADTLLSDKFVLVKDEGTGAPLLVEGDILNGITPTTFDQLARTVDDTLEGLSKTLNGDASGKTKDLFTKINQLIENTQSLLTELKPVVQDAAVVISDAKGAVADAKVTVADARSLISDNRAGISKTIARLDTAAGSVDSLAKKGEALIRDNEKNISSSLSGLRVTSENLKVTSTYSKFLLRDLFQRPSRLLWGGKPPILPSQQEILDSRQPIPDR
jgi:ABC-type transporter Mla subunit MlaD